MNSYHNFIGVDIAKDSFVVARHGHNGTYTFENSSEGFDRFYQDFKPFLAKGLVVLETTGGYEWALLCYLHERQHAIHRADGRKVKNYIKSLRNHGKTDKIDAHALACYAKERHDRLALFQMAQVKQLRLKALVRRRAELIEGQTKEKNRFKSPLSFMAKGTFELVLKAYAEQIQIIDDMINEIIDFSQDYEMKHKIITALPGIGEKTAHGLLALVPELGFLTRRQVASIGGVAPHPFDSGSKNGRRKTRGGRKDVKALMFMAALAASRSKSWLGDYYREMIKRGKKPIVAMTALIRKMLVIMNGRVRDAYIGNGIVLGAE